MSMVADCGERRHTSSPAQIVCITCGRYDGHTRRPAATTHDRLLSPQNVLFHLSSIDVCQTDRDQTFVLQFNLKLVSQSFVIDSLMEDAHSMRMHSAHTCLQPTGIASKLKKKNKKIDWRPADTFQTSMWHSWRIESVVYSVFFCYCCRFRFDHVRHHSAMGY